MVTVAWPTRTPVTGSTPGTSVTLVGMPAGAFIMLTVPVGEAPIELASTAMDRVLVSPAGAPGSQADPITFKPGVAFTMVKAMAEALLGL